MATSSTKQTEQTKTVRPKPKIRQEQVPERNGVSPDAIQRAIADPLSARPEEIIALQQTVGNQAVNDLVANATASAEALPGSMRVQAKLAVGPAGDAYEQEADRVAETVLRMPAPVQRVAQPVKEEEEEEQAQRKEQEAVAEAEEVKAQRETAPVQRKEDAGDEDEEPLLLNLFGGQHDSAGSDGAGDDGGNENGSGNGHRSPTPVLQRQPEEADEIDDEEKEGYLQRWYAGEGSAAGDDSGGDGENNDQGQSPIVQRQDAPRPADPGAGFDVGGDVERQIASGAGGGKPLPESTRNFLEPRFGANFGGVRVHTGPQSDSLNQQLSAQAFTHGSDIYMASGKYNPGTTAGNRLLAHELTHVVQQGGAGAPPAAAQTKRAPARRKAVAASKDGSQTIRRFLSQESQRAFTTAVKANPKYVSGEKLVDKYATPIAEPQSGDPAPWQTQVDTEMNYWNVLGDEQNKINKMPLSHRLAFWKKSGDQEKKLEDFVRAFLLWDFASRTNQLRPDPAAKYGSLEDAKKNAKRKAYMKHAQPFQTKFKGLVSKGPAAAETKAFLQQEGFLDDMGLSDKQTADRMAEDNLRIDVRSTFIGGPILGINLRAHLFIVYTGRDGRQTYFRGGPGGGNPTGNDLGFTKVDYGDYAAETIDYDPSAPSVTVMQGPEVEGKFDALIEASQAVNAAEVPYVAATETWLEKKAPWSWLRTAGQAFAMNGENCNRAAYTILSRAGIPTKKPLGKHPGWGKIMGADTPGKRDSLPLKEEDKEPQDYKLSTFKEITDQYKLVQVYLDREFLQKMTKLPVGTEVKLLQEGTEWRKIRIGENQVGYIAKNERDTKRAWRAIIREVLEVVGWDEEDDLDKITDEMENDNYGRAQQILSAAGMPFDSKNVRLLYDILVEFYHEFQTPADVRFRDMVAKMPENELMRLKHDFDEMKALVKDVGVDMSDAVDIVNEQIGLFERRDKVLKAIWDEADFPEELNYWINHLPKYEQLDAIVDETGEDFNYVVGLIDSLRPEANRKKFLAEIFGDADFDTVELVAEDDESVAAEVDEVAKDVGVLREFVVKRAKDYVAQAKRAAQEEEERQRREEEERQAKMGLNLAVYRYNNVKSPETGGYEPQSDGFMTPDKADFINEDEEDGAWTVIVDGSTGNYYWVKTLELRAFLNPPVESSEKEKAGPEPSNYPPQGKHRWPFEDAMEVMVSLTEDGPIDTKFTVDPDLAGARVVVLDALTQKNGRCRLEHNGKVVYIPLDDVFGKPKSAPKEELDMLDDEMLELLVGDLMGMGGKEKVEDVLEEEQSAISGVLRASVDAPVVMYDDNRNVEELATLEEDTKMNVFDAGYASKTVELIDVENVDYGEKGVIYAYVLKKAFEPTVVESVSVEPTTVVEKDEESSQVGSGLSTEDYREGILDWPFEDDVTLMVAKSEAGPVDIRKTFTANGKFKRITIMDNLTVTCGRCILQHNGDMYYMPLPDLERVIQELLGEDIEDSVDSEDDEYESEEPSVSSSNTGVDEETVQRAYQRILLLFQEQGESGLDVLLSSYMWLYDALDIALDEDFEGREDRAHMLATTLDDDTADAEYLLMKYGEH